MRVLACWFAVTFAIMANTACAATTPSLLPPPAATFEDLLGSQDLVVTGQVLKATERSLGYKGGCGFRSDLSVLPVTEIDLQVERVINGVADNDKIHVTILDQGFGPLIGQQILVWAHRSCQDGGNLRGWLGVIESDGMIGRGNGRPFKRWGRIPLARLDSPSVTQRFYSSRLFNGAGAVALARVISVDPWSTDGATYHIEGIGWAVGQGASIPKEIWFPRQELCYPNISAGDTILVPVRPGDRSRLTLRTCPRALRVKDGRADGLGAIEISSLDRVLQRSGGALELRTYQQREQ